MIETKRNMFQEKGDCCCFVTI